MKILHVIPDLRQAAGTSVFCVHLCENLSKLGVETAIAVRRVTPDDTIPQGNIPLLTISRTFDSLEFKPDLVHIHALWNPFLHWASRWARRATLPVVFSPHGMLTPWALGQKRIKKALALAVYQYRDLKLTNLLHATADSEVQDVRRLGLRQPVVVAPLGVAIDPILPRRTRHDSDPRIALFVSRIHPKKGLVNLVNAWAAIKPCGWKMVVAGPDQDGHEREIKDLAETKGVAQDFEFVGAVFGKEKDRLYNQADLFVLPTHSENFGVVVLEALAAGVPVITTKGAPWQALEGSSCHSALVSEQSAIGNTQLAIGNKQSATGGDSTHALMNSRTNELPPAHTGRAGWWIDIGVEPLAEALKEAMGLSDEERRTMGEDGRRLVEAKYTWPAIAEQMKTAYEWMLNRDQTPPPCVRVS